MSKTVVNGISISITLSILIAIVRTDVSNSSPIAQLFKTIATCSEGNAFRCLKDRTVHMIDAASDLDRLTLWDDTLALVKYNSEADNETVNDSSSGRSLSDSVAHFIDTHRIQVTLPRLSFFLTSSEGRGKKNRGYGLIALTIAGALMAAGMAALAAMAGKALAASMAALAVATLAALRKGGGHGGGHSSYEVISLPSHHHHRSFLDKENIKPSPYSDLDHYSSPIEDK